MMEFAAGAPAGGLQWEGFPVNAHILIAPLVALLAGILILIQPRLLNFIVAIYLIIIGVVGLLPALQH
jgi:Protein of unknown function (DUF3096)